MRAKTFKVVIMKKKSQFQSEQIVFFVLLNVTNQNTNQTKTLILLPNEVEKFFGLISWISLDIMALKFAMICTALFQG